MCLVSIDIFGQDASGVVEQVYYDGGWASAFLEPTTSPTDAVISACAPDNGSVDMFWKDSDGNIQHYYYDGAWRPQNRIDLFGIDDAGNWLHVAHGWVPENLP